MSAPRHWTRTSSSAALCAALLLGCREASAPTPTANAAVESAVAPVPASTAESDPLGPRPPVPTPPLFTPPVPVVWQRPDGLTVWLVERHQLPLVTLRFVIPAGSASDPAGKAGLAYHTAQMLDEGAGARGAIEVAGDLDRLGAVFDTAVTRDFAALGVSSLTRNLTPAAEILGDIVSQPRFDEREWKRVHELWRNDLRARASEPEQVARIVADQQVFGASSPYGHPVDGTLRSVAAIGLADVKKFYAEHWRADRATLVAVGDLSRQELDPLLDRVLAKLKKGGAAAQPQPAKDTTPQAAAATPAPARRVVLIDRADAPQAVLVVARPGVPASERAQLSRANQALGGSFTSRLNQDLRENHGWTYGARSQFSANARPGTFSATAPVQTEHAGEALKAMLSDMETFARSGLTDEELGKTLQLTQSDLIDEFDTVRDTAVRLAVNAGLGLPADQAKRDSEQLHDIPKAALDRLVAEHTDPAAATIVIVGPRAAILPQLQAIGITSVESASADLD